MGEKYPVWVDDRQMGTVEVYKTGLFLKIYCKCALPDNRVYKLYAQNGAGVQGLGIFVPEKDAYSVRTNIQERKLELQNVRFFTLPVDRNTQVSLVHVCEDVPFRHLEQLEEASCVLREGSVYLTMNGNHSDCDE